jgi:hypothetical protein
VTVTFVALSLPMPFIGMIPLGLLFSPVSRAPPPTLHMRVAPTHPPRSAASTQVRDYINRIRFNKEYTSYDGMEHIL